jgi:hypothetical protein
MSGMRFQQYAEFGTPAVSDPRRQYQPTYHCSQTWIRDSAVSSMSNTTRSVSVPSPRASTKSNACIKALRTSSS